MRRVLLWAPVVVYTAAIFYVSSLSDPPMPEGISDRPLHGLAYVGLAIVVARAVAGGLPRRIGARAATASLLITVAYGASDEIHQMFVAGRSAEWYDLVADAAGALIGVAGCWAWGIISPSHDEL
ncbi:MAG: VanZ family protein [Acidobacteria bacterium]|nr:VanZ family protein [Acidobacteriota bacterium]